MKEFRSLIDIERNELIYKLVLEIGKEKGCLVTLLFFNESIEWSLILTKAEIRDQKDFKLLILFFQVHASVFSMLR
jgi:hypothetical protein